MGTSVKRSTSLKQIVDRAEGYDIAGFVVDGMNLQPDINDKLAEGGDRFDPEDRIRLSSRFAPTAIAGIPCRTRRAIAGSSSGTGCG